MVSVKYRYSNICKSLKRDIPIGEFEELLFKLGFELDGYEDDEVNVDLGAERLDLLTEEGFIRMLKGYFGYKEDLPILYEGNYEIHVSPEVKDVRPYIVGFVVKDLDVDEEVLEKLIYVQEKIHHTFGRNRKKVAIGIYPLKMKFPIYYRLKKPEEIKFTPLGENKVMDGREILELHEKGQEYGHLIKDFPKYPVVEDSEGKILSMPPIINSREVGEVKPGDRELFVECTGNDLELLNKVINVLSIMFNDLGGKIYKVEIYDEFKMESPYYRWERRIIKKSYVEKIAGEKIDNIKQLLERSGYRVKGDGDSFLVRIPPYRHDILHEIDIVDDILRMYDFNNLHPRIPNTHSFGELSKKTAYVRKLEHEMIALGFAQTFSMILTSESRQKAFIHNWEPIKLGNVEEKSLNMMRVSLLPEMLDFLNKNKKAKYPQKLFEVGECVKRDMAAYNRSHEELHFAALITHDRANISEIVEVLKKVALIFGWDISVENTDLPAFIEGRCAVIKHKDEIIGHIGEILPGVLRDFNLIRPVVAFEINISHFIG